MAENYLITGYHGEPHVTVENQRGVNAGIVGSGRYVLPVGNRLRAEYIGSNIVRLYDGKLMDNGAAAGIPAGEYIDLPISSASQGMKRNDLIVFEYEKDLSTRIETGTFKVIMGTETTGMPADPTLTQADLAGDQATIDQMPLWRMSVSGTTIDQPVQVFARTGALAHIPVFYENETNTVYAYRNFLDNSDFTNPVNQKGQTSYTGAGRTIDRWKATNANTQVTVNAKKSVKFAAGSGGTAYFQQLMETAGADYRGKALTLCVQTEDGTTYVHAGTFPTQAPSAEKAVLSIQIGACRINLYSSTALAPFVQINVPAGENVALRRIALYEGAYTADALPPWVEKGFTDELHACQRFYLPLKAGAPLGSAYTYVSGTSGLLFIQTPVTMRVNPTLNQTSGFLRCAGKSLPVTFSSATAHASGVNIAFTINPATPSEIGTVYVEQSGLDLDADL